MSGWYIVTVKIPIEVKGLGWEDGLDEGKKWFEKNFKYVGEGTPVIEYECENEDKLADVPDDWTYCIAYFDEEPSEDEKKAYLERVFHGNPPKKVAWVKL